MTKLHVGGIGLFRKKFDYLELACREARSGDDIILHKNVSVTSCRLPGGVTIEGNNHTITTTTGDTAIWTENSARVEIRNVSFRVRNQSRALVAIGSEITLENVTAKYIKRYRSKELYPAILVVDNNEKDKSTVKIDNSNILAKIGIDTNGDVTINNCRIGELLHTPISRIKCNTFKSLNNVYSNTQLIVDRNGISDNDETLGNLYFLGDYKINNLRGFLDFDNAKKKHLTYYRSFMQEWFRDNGLTTCLVRLGRGKYILDNLSLLKNLETGNIVENISDMKLYLLWIYDSDVTLKNSELKSNPALFKSGTLTFENTKDSLKWLYNPKATTIVNKNSTSSLLDAKNSNSPQNRQSALQEIDNQIGQGNVKQKLREVISMAQQRVYQKQLAEKSGTVYNEDTGFSNHMIFSGSAGTGKTTFARLVGKALFEGGVLPENKFTEASPKDLVAGYVGQTRTKTHELIMKSLGGVLFIDEAYGLDENGKNSSFNKEAIDQLIADMENYRDQLVVIMAGYTTDMRSFINNGNEGLRSRFNNWVGFEDYTPEELLDILWSMLSKQNAIVTDDEVISALGYEVSYLSQYISGNGRFVRNFVQKIMEKKAFRLSYITDIDQLDTKEQYQILNTITLDDVQKAVDEMKKQYEIADEYIQETDAFLDDDMVIDISVEDFDRALAEKNRRFKSEE